MPKTTIHHEPWCAEHIGPEVGLSEMCTTNTVDFGPPMPTRPDEPVDENDTRGSMFVQLAEDEPDAVVMVEWAPHFGHLDLTALRAVRAALAADPERFLIAIDKTLCAIETGVLA